VGVKHIPSKALEWHGIWGLQGGIGGGSIVVWSLPLFSVHGLLHVFQGIKLCRWLRWLQPR
jgi:hypothetical protein